MQHIIKAFALAGAGLVSTSANYGEPPVEASVKTEISQVSLMRPPTQEDRVMNAVSDFRTLFMGRVAANDRSGHWDKCYSTRNRQGATLPYNTSLIKSMRQADNWNKRNIEVTFQTPQKPQLTPLAAAFSPDTKVQETFTKPIIVIDLGHGESGQETGASEGHVLEAKVADAVGAQLSKILRMQHNAIVVTTRSPFGKRDELMPGRSTRFGNQDKSLQLRAETANYLREKFPESDVVFISLHTNRAVGPAGILPGVRGGLVFSYSPQENGASASKESRSLARHIASAYSMRKSTEARTNDYAVLRCQPENAAAVLLELGFNTNPDDRAMFSRILVSEDTAGKYALQIANGIGAYLREHHPEPKKLAPDMQIASLDIH